MREDDRSTARRPAAGGDDDPELLTAAEAARYLRVDRSWLYAHARELGGWRLLGDRGEWRFSRRHLLSDTPRAGPGAPVGAKLQPRPRAARPPARPTVELLPIGPRRFAGR